MYQSRCTTEDGLGRTVNEANRKHVIAHAWAQSTNMGVTTHGIHVIPRVLNLGFSAVDMHIQNNHAAAMPTDLWHVHMHLSFRD